MQHSQILSKTLNKINTLTVEIFDSGFRHVGAISKDSLRTVTSTLVTDVGDQMCRWQVRDVDDRFKMLVTDLIH